MTDKIMEARRAAFNAAWDSDLRWRKHHGMFEGEKEIAEEIWNAALDSVCVNLPERWDDNCGSFYKDDNGPHMESIEVIEAIHTAGVRTK